MLKSADNALILVHVTCRFHLYLHACSMHVSCNMHGIGTIPCMLHVCYIHATCMQESSIIDCFPKVLKLWISHRYVSRGEVSETCDERFKTITYMTYLAYVVFLTCVMFLTCNLHVTCLLFSRCSCYMRCACYTYFNMHITCILPVL